jgi:hypothetical protein
MAPKKAKQTPVKASAKSPAKTPVTRSGGSSFPRLHPGSLRSLAEAAGFQGNTLAVSPIMASSSQQQGLFETPAATGRTGTGTGTAKLPA